MLYDREAAGRYMAAAGPKKGRLRIVDKPDEPNSEPLRVLSVTRGLFDRRDAFRTGFQTRTLSETEAVANCTGARRPIELAVLDFEERWRPAEGEETDAISRLRSLGIRTRVVDIPIPRPRITALAYLLWSLEAIWGVVVIAAAARKERSHLIQTHGEWATFTSIAASRLLRLPLVCETHGILDELFDAEKGLGLGYRAAKAFEKICMRNSRHLIVVSEAMKDHFARSYPVPALVVPYSVDGRFLEYGEREREEARRELGLTGGFVLVYSGTFFTTWQQPDKMAAAFGELRKRVANGFFLVLTTDEGAAVRDYLVSRGLEESDFRIVKVSHEEVPRYLVAGDAGLLIRERGIVSQVSCPLKLVEYLACGLPILCAQGIGDFSGMVQERGVGVVVDNELEGVDWDGVCGELLELAAPEIRERCRSIAWEKFTWGSNAAAIADLYAHLVEAGRAERGLPDRRPGRNEAPRL